MPLLKKVKEAIWRKGITGELGITEERVKINFDSQSSIHLVNHQVYHGRTKHMDICLHFIRDVIESKEIQVQKVPL